MASPKHSCPFSLPFSGPTYLSFPVFKHEFYSAGRESYLDLVFKLEAFSVVLSIQLTNKMLVTRKE